MYCIIILLLLPVFISSSSCSTLSYQWLGSLCFYPFHGRIIWHWLSLSKEQQLPSIATNTAVCPLVSWSVIASFTSFAMCKPLRRIHSRFPISTEYTWEADGPSWREKRKTRDLQMGDMPETLCLRTTVSGCTSYWNTLQRFSFVSLWLGMATSKTLHLGAYRMKWGLFEVLLSWPNPNASPLPADSLRKRFSFKTHFWACLYTELRHELNGSICTYLPLRVRIVFLDKRSMHIS